MDFLQNHIEALIFCTPSPIKVVDIKACLSEMFNADVPEEDIMGAIQRLEEKFLGEEFSFQLFRAGGGYQFLTKPAYQASIGIMLKQQSKKRLSTSAMETLSIIAYKQPISKTEIENIRGVNCDYAVQKLLDKSLIEITGKADTIGRPMLYGTTPKFMEYFGINDINELPVPKDFANEVNTIGENPEISDAPSAFELEGRAESETQASFESETHTETETLEQPESSSESQPEPGSDQPETDNDAQI
ncbi:SMC-Scp complex subunit ScpB [Chryseolinea lacunae]|uniref:SMC-Scp complex subunit ScpB n=1 Tax=Chryseolinea lacunae TaxID=2801331 RepID=A0ABS1KU67_9BACT|nr:SMC-Scp complex subunit ScpB [Chryseolinea lacunae]